MKQWEVRYVGAPYGTSDYGEVLSRHKSYEAAVDARQRLQEDPRFYGACTVVAPIGEAPVNAIAAQYR